MAKSRVNLKFSVLDVDDEGFFAQVRVAVIRSQAKIIAYGN